MEYKAIKFELSGDYALFKKPFANNQPQSFVIPPKTAILGMIGAIMGWSKEEYIKTLPFEKFGYAVRLVTSKIKKETVGINLMQGKDAKFTFNENPIKNPPNRGQRSPTRYEFIKDIKWEIFLMIEDAKIQNEFFERLKSKKFIYNPNLGMQQLFAKIDNEEIIDIKPIDDNIDDIYTSFERNLIKFIINEPVTFYNELLPISFNIDRSLPITKEMISFVGDYSIEITNFNELSNLICQTCQSNCKIGVYQDDNRRLYQFI